MNQNRHKQPKFKHTAAKLFKGLEKHLIKVMNTVEKIFKQQREKEKRHVAHAKFPCLELMQLFGIHLVIGCLLSLNISNWSILGWGIAILISLTFTIFAFDDLMFTYNYCFAVMMDVLASPWTRAAKQLKDVFSRWIFNSNKADWLIDLLQAFVPLVSFLLVLMVDALGFGIGYLISRIGAIIIA
ncbi:MULTISPECIES: hypothetical protein [Nostoc]|uniref:Uncharacterized protein n=1 Tax=Nostoc paludosum FACHB-159 TaxID=2692908 RepID=A0ABR8KGN5_9NOSO|nr:MULTISPECIES: hypothetical protein [Nostoc]MBD2680886.1 hypothetical protein [Nostoc sp. FACHB-857]MBD2737363.1 hypothetical protein [Nostoc paludosum FACHB-159]